MAHFLGLPNYSAASAFWLITLSASSESFSSVSSSSFKVASRRETASSRPSSAAPGFQGAIARNFVMLDGLSCADQAGIQGGRVFVFLDDLLAFIDNPRNGGAVLAARGLVDQPEYFFQSVDLFRRLEDCWSGSGSRRGKRSGDLERRPRKSAGVEWGNGRSA